MTKGKISDRPRVLVINRAIVINGAGKILIIKRSEKDLYNPGLWEAPGGKMEQGQDISTALEREVLEEANLVVMPIDKVAYYRSGIVTNNPRYNGLTYIEIFGLTKIIGGKVKLSKEHTDFKWITFNEVSKFKLVDSSKEAILVLEEKIRNAV